MKTVRLHILFLANGGSPNTANWVRHYASVLGHRISLVSFDPIGKPIDGVETFDLSGGSKLKYFLRVPTVRRLIRKLSPDLLLAYRVTSYGLTGLLSGFRPFAVAAMGRDLDLPDGSVLKRSAARVTIRGADLIHSWSENMTERILALGGDPSRIVTLPRGVDTDIFYPARRGNNDLSGPRLICTRSLDPYYRVDLIIEAVARLVPEFPGIQCQLIGDGPERAALRNLSANLGIADRIEFMGQLAYPRVAELLRESDLYVSAVPTDGTSSSLLEAMASGVFPVVVDNSANRVWIRSGRNGLLFSAGDADALAERLTEAARDSRLREAAREENLQEIAARATWAANMKIMESYHLGLLGRFRNSNHVNG